MSEMRLEPPTSAPSPPSPPPQTPDPSEGSLAAGVGLAWVIMIVGEILVILTNNFDLIFVGIMLPPLAVIVYAAVLLGQGKKRTGLGMFLGLLSIVAVVFLLVAACFGLFVR